MQIRILYTTVLQMLKIALLNYLFAVPIMAQTGNTFMPAFISGVRFSQIDGDNMAGYNHVGPELGARVDVRFAELWAFSLELLYTVKGARTSSDPGQVLLPSRVSIAYAEVPLLVQFHDPNGLVLGAGLAYGRVARFTRIENGINTSDQGWQPGSNDLSIVADASWFFSGHWGLGGRFSYSIRPIGFDPASQLPRKQLLNNSVTLRLMYRIIRQD